MIESMRMSVDRLGWTGVAGVALIAIAIGLHFSVLVPRQSRLAQLHAEAASLQERLRTGASITQMPRAAGAEQLAAFYAFFPPGDSTPDWLAKIHNAARSSGITLQSGEYKLDRRPDQKLGRYQMTLPAAGTYSQLREFIRTLLVQVPAAALDEVTLRRDNVASPTVEARLRLTLYLSSGAGQP